MRSTRRPVLVNIYMTYYQVFKLQSGHDFVTDRRTDRRTTIAKTLSPNAEVGTYKNKEKPLKRQSKLGLGIMISLAYICMWNKTRTLDYKHDIKVHVIELLKCCSTVDNFHVDTTNATLRSPAELAAHVANKDTRLNCGAAYAIKYTEIQTI